MTILAKNFFSKGFSLEIGHGILGGLSELIEGLSGVTKTVITTKTYVSAMLEIAAALALMAAAMVAMSLVDGKKLQGSLLALGIGMGYLITALKLMADTSGVISSLKLPVLAASLVVLAAGIDVLVIAVVALSRLNWNELAKGLTGVGILLAEVSAAAIPLSKNSKGMIAAGAGITAMAVGINIMAIAVKQLGDLNIATLGKGLGGVAVALASIGACI